MPFLLDHLLHVTLIMVLCIIHFMSAVSIPKPIITCFNPPNTMRTHRVMPQEIYEESPFA
ncbi:unnamed protein product [Hymenolepis diminuta]|uniref:Uncharacterized protein n=1 Tax=Hymenolepis diminuta TaxID=6216 RepID=A0A564Y295_HYMDI|nr:unnamed protein product [Hymenolepis diminuta]